jgi:putative ABC transport system permease protein
VPAATSLLIRTQGNPEALVRAVGEVVRELDPDQPVRGLRTMDQLHAEILSPLEFISTLLAAFAGIALGLAAVGIYGVVSHSVAQRRREFGIRMALGASERAVIREVLRQGAGIAAVALVLGAAGVGAVIQLLVRQVPWVRGAGPQLFAAVAALIVAITLAACWFPARRAVKLDPMAVLRAE